MKKLAIVLLFLSAHSMLLRAQNHVVTLKIIDKVTGKSLSNSLAYLFPAGEDVKRDMSKKIEANLKGQIIINIPNTPKKWQIFVNAIGYSEGKISLQTSNTEHTKLFFTIKLDPVNKE